MKRICINNEGCCFIFSVFCGRVMFREKGRETEDINHVWEREQNEIFEKIMYIYIYYIRNIFLYNLIFPVDYKAKL